MMKPRYHFYTIFDWMHKTLELKGNELFIFAYIYSYTVSNGGTGRFYGSAKGLCEEFGITEPTVNSTLKKLVAKNYLCKFYNGSKGFCKDIDYVANIDFLKSKGIQVEFIN